MERWNARVEDVMEMIVPTLILVLLIVALAALVFVLADAAWAVAA